MSCFVAINNVQNMSLEERTLVVRGFDDRVTRDLLRELFVQAGPVVNVVLRTDFAFIEFEHKISVAYALALLSDISLYRKPLCIEPKLRYDNSYYQFVDAIKQFNQVMYQNPDFFCQFMPNPPNTSRPTPPTHHRSHESQNHRSHNQYNQRSQYDNNYRSHNHQQNHRSYEGNNYHSNQSRYEDRRYDERRYDRSYDSGRHWRR
ncbi:unnamed protein product [Medioppia subpectinata]|uniref:RRM domain-containing protein n=1 Tax=Medioppia subpectinata TaxID=1979941 RepID=A0A7R9PX15_9ACAR|nr:unnamed protein product [Medioppia subpectinata]CAG2104548.1 unnamed protein product [Medioppia subpectinata]